MESRAKLLGHPIHQMLIVFPLGLLATAVFFDLLAIALTEGYWSELAYWMIAAGVVTGLVAHRLARLTGLRFLPALVPSKLERYTESEMWLSCCCSPSAG